MAKARELKRRIRSVENTRKITRTMEMVSTSKLKRAQDRVVGARPYAQALAEVLGDLYSPVLAERFPLLRQPGAVKRVGLLLVTSNRGLCGAFNANLIREARRRIQALERSGAQVDLHLVGKKGVTFFKFSKRPVASQRIDIADRPSTAHAAEIVAPLIEQFETGRLDAVELVFAKFNSAVSTPATVVRILPVEGWKVGKSEGAAPSSNYILKPSAEAILEKLLPLYVRNQVYRALVETAAAEHGARRTAMKNATDNAGEMLDILRRTYNRARQAQITQELAEIVGGAEALRG